MAFITKKNLNKVRKSNPGLEPVSPTGRQELIDIIKDAIEKYGPEVDLNFIDVSGVTNMAYVFKADVNCEFNGDISQWDVSHVFAMRGMFIDSKFNGDISQWDVGSVTDMKYMFIDSEFNGDISDWDVSSVEKMQGMFSGENTKFNGDISRWNVSKVNSFADMFEDNKYFEGDISGWDVENAIDYAEKTGNYPFLNMFFNSKLLSLNKIPKWYKPYMDIH